MSNPAIVIPGYLGSKLAESVHRKLVWLDSHGLLNPEVTLEALRLDIGDPDRIVPTGILDEVVVLPPFWDPDVYKGLTAFLRDNLRLRVFEFYYDWRKSLEAAADLLNNQVLRWLHETGAPKVDLVAHSFGGLVARAYLAKHGPDKVDRLITLGTPHKGAVEALETLVRGRRLFTFPAGKVRQVSRTFPSLYEVAPSDPADRMFLSGGQPANPMQVNGWCESQPMRDLLAAAAARMPALLPAQLPVETWMISGTRISTSAVAAFDQGAMTFTQNDHGDGTVPEVSARGNGLGGQNVFRFTIPFGPHVRLFGLEKVQQRILTPILLGRPVPDFHLFSGFQNEPLFVPRTANTFAAAVFRKDGQAVLDADVRLTISGSSIQNQRVQLSNRQDYELRINRMPGPGGGHPYTVTARLANGEILTDRGLLVPTER
jgi:hypothetical protein